MLDPEQRENLYGLKAELKREQFLEQDYRAMNRTQFERYLEAKARMLIQEQLDAGNHPNEAFHVAQAQLKLIDHLWRKEAKRLATGQIPAEQAVARVVHNAAVTP